MWYGEWDSNNGKQGGEENMRSKNNNLKRTKSKQGTGISLNKQINTSVFVLYTKTQAYWWTYCTISWQC